MINFFSQAGSSFGHLDKSTVVIPSPSFEGYWASLELQPDLFAPQRFSVGIVTQAPNDRIHYHLLSEFKKFECVYSSRFAKDAIGELLRHAEEVLRLATKEKTPIDKVDFGSANLYLSAPAFTAGESAETVISRLYSDVVVMEPHANEKRPREFNTIDTPGVRDLVNEALKRIALNDYEKIVLDSQDGFVKVDADNRPHHFDVNLRTRSAYGSVVSAVYKNIQNVEMNLLRANLDLSTLAKIDSVSDKGVFMMLPQRTELDAKDWLRLENIVDAQSWKLEKDGFRVVALDTAHSLAEEIYEWAKPTI